MRFASPVLKKWILLRFGMKGVVFKCFRILNFLQLASNLFLQNIRCLWVLVNNFPIHGISDFFLHIMLSYPESIFYIFFLRGLQKKYLPQCFVAVPTSFCRLNAYSENLIAKFLSARFLFVNSVHKLCKLILIKILTYQLTFNMTP